MKKSFTYNRGESLINNPKSFKTATTHEWFMTENLKYNLTLEKPLTIEEMYDELNKKDKNRLNNFLKRKGFYWDSIVSVYSEWGIL